MIAYTWLKLHCDLAAPAQNSEALSHEAPFQKKKKCFFGYDQCSAKRQELLQRAFDRNPLEALHVFFFLPVFPTMSRFTVWKMV